MAAAICLLAGFVWHSAGLYRDRVQARNALVSKDTAVTVTAGTAGDRVESGGQTYRRNTYVKAVLCIGVDRRGDMKERTVPGSGGQADGIFLAAWDTARNTIRFLAIPRDTITRITLTDLSGNVLGKDEQHIALAYGYGDGREQSCRYLSEAVSELLGGLKMDGYAAMNITAISMLNDLVGGVEVTVDGTQRVLMGEQAEAFVRYRNIGVPQSALERTERQKQYIEGFSLAFREKVGGSDSFVPDVMDQLSPYVITNLGKDQCLDMSLAFSSGENALGPQDLQTLPGTAVETDLYDEYHPDREAAQEMVLNLFYRVEK